MTDGNVCRNCGTKNRPGALLCDKCGMPLHKEISTMTTRHIKSSEGLGEFPSQEVTGTSQFTEDTTLALYIQDASAPVILKVIDRITLGRDDPTRTIRPDVDLTEFGAETKGVSRLHATFVRQGETLLLKDIRSTNGTFINDQRVPPDDPQLLRDGDKIRLGELKIRILFR